MPDPERKSPASPLPPPRGLLCELCGAKAVEIHCRVACTVCGYERDCSDP